MPWPRPVHVLVKKSDSTSTQQDAANDNRSNMVCRQRPNRPCLEYAHDGTVHYSACQWNFREGYMVGEPVHPTSWWARSWQVSVLGHDEFSRQMIDPQSRHATTDDSICTYTLSGLRSPTWRSKKLNNRAVQPWYQTKHFDIPNTHAYLYQLMLRAIITCRYYSSIVAKNQLGTKFKSGSWNCLGMVKNPTLLRFVITKLAPSKWWCN